MNRYNTRRRSSPIPCPATTSHSVCLCCRRLLATCSEDGSIRLWGSSKTLQRFMEDEDKEDVEESSFLESFLGIGYLLYSSSSAFPLFRGFP